MAKLKRYLRHDTYDASAVAFFMIVSFPEEAAETICASIDLFIFADKAYDWSILVGCPNSLTCTYG
jgi:hypothetical protein